MPTGPCSSVFGRLLRQVVHLRLGRVFPPEARDPLVPAVGLVPITGDPFDALRHGPPDAAGPDEFLLVGLVAPITGDPDDVIAGRLLFRRHFFDRVRRLLGNDRAGRRIEHDRLGEGLVNGALRQDFGIGIIGGRLFRRRNVAGGSRIRRRVLSGIRRRILRRKEIGGAVPAVAAAMRRILRRREVLGRNPRHAQRGCQQKRDGPATTSPRTRRPLHRHTPLPFCLSTIDATL